jgi:hypothetical protein
MWSDNSYYRFKCPEHIDYANLTQELFDHIYLNAHSYILEDLHGTGTMLCTLTDTSILPIDQLPSSQQILDWIKQKIIETAPTILGHAIDTVTITRTWANIMVKGNTGQVHNHDSSYPQGIALFYCQVPPNSSDLVLVENAVSDSELSDYDPAHCLALNVAQGQLIIHTSKILHGLTEHLSDIPRLVWVIEYC